MSTSSVIPPPGFQLEQNDSPDVKSPTGFQLETNDSSNQGATVPKEQPQGIAPPSQARPPAGFELEKPATAVHGQQPAMPPRPHPARANSRNLGGGRSIKKTGSVQSKQTSGPAQGSSQTQGLGSSSSEIEAGERILQIRTPRQQQSDAMLDSILHPERYYPSFIESMAPRMREALGNRVAAAIRAGLEPPMPSESTVLARKASGIPTLAPPAGPDFKHPAGMSYWTNLRTGQRVPLDPVPEQQAIPILDSWVGLEPMATGINRIKENSPSKTYFTLDDKGRLVPHAEYVPGQVATPEEISRHNRQQMLGMAETLQGGMQVASPLMVGTAATAPVKAALWLGAGYATEEAGGALLHGHVSPEAENLARTLLVMAPGALAGSGGFKTGSIRSRVLPLTPETFETFIKPNLRPGYITDFAEFQLRNPGVTHMTVTQSGGRVGVSALGTEQQMQPLAFTAGGASLFGGRLRGGVGSTSEAYGGGIGIGDTNLNVRIPRGRGATATTPLESAQTMLRYEQRVGNLPKPKPRAPSQPLAREALSPQSVRQLTEKVANLPEAQRGDAMAQAHQVMTASMLNNVGKPFLGPDHKLHIVNNHAEAQKLALEFINDQVGLHDKRLAEAQAALQKSSENKSAPTLPDRQLSSGPRANARQSVEPAAESLRSSSPEEPARIDPNFKLDRVNANLMRFGVQPSPAAPPVMGRRMTANAPAVRKVQAQASPVPGQVPEVKVKQEPPRVQNALTQPPAPVSPEEAGRIGQAEAQSGRQILQPSNSLVQNERLAADSAPFLTTKLSQAAASVPGASFDRLRPQKGLQRLQEKVADGKPPSTIGDNLAAQIVANTVAAKDQLIARLRQQFPVINVDDKFLEPRDKAGYPSTNLQLQMPNGGTAEVQIVAPEIQAITDQTHRLYTQGRNFPEGSAERAHYWDQAAAMHRQALEKFQVRNAQPSATTFAPGEKVVLRNGEAGKVVGPSRDLRRIVVRTGNGMRTVRPGDVRVRSITPNRKAARPDFDPRDLKKFAGKIKSRIGAPESQRGEIVLLNTDALHEIHKAMKDHSFAGVTLPGNLADDVIAKIRVRADKTGREDLDLLADHLDRARSQYGVVPLALEGSNEATNMSANLEERIHGAQMDMGKGLIENYGDAERDYTHPVTPQFFNWLQSRGVDPNDKVMTVAEISDLILRGDHSEAGVSDQDALDWLGHHLRTVRQIHGPDALNSLKRLAHGIAATHFRRRSQ